MQKSTKRLWELRNFPHLPSDEQRLMSPSQRRFNQTTDTAQLMTIRERHFPARTIFLIVGEATPPLASTVTANVPAVCTILLGLKSILILPFGST